LFFLQSVTNYSSQIGGERPVSCTQYSPDGKMLATADWTGLCRLWTVPNCKPVRNLRGHNDKAGWITWHPNACISQSASAINLASCAHDGSVSLWNLESYAFDEIDVVVVGIIR
jgi:U4/U6 small nuclear ribonucleoprotein PRP4